MIILPAIDLKDGKCVRLFQGDYATAEQVASVLLLSWLALLTPHWFPSEFLWVY